MSKGYVRALAEQINQGSMKHVEENDGGKSPEDDEMRHSLAYSVIRAAERQKSKTENDPASPTKKASKTTGYLYSHSNSEIATITLNTKHVADFLTKANGDISPENLSAKNDKEIPDTKPSKESAQPFRSHAQRNVSEACSSKPSLKSWQRQSSSISSISSVSPLSSTAPPPYIDRGTKPKIPPKKPSLTSSQLNSHKDNAPFHSIPASQLDSNTCRVSSSPVLSPQSPELTPASVPLVSNESNDAKFSDSGSHSGKDSHCFCSTNTDLLTSPSSASNNEVSFRLTSKRSSEQYRDSVFNTIYDNAPPINAAELFDSSWSDSDSCNGLTDEDETEPKGEKSLLSKVETSTEAKVTDHLEGLPEDKRFCIAEELLKTERDYVDRLHLVHQIFFFELDKENRQQAFLPPDALKFMFSNIKSIYLFHHDFLLPQLEDRMENWEMDPRIGDLMKKNAPFLKLYTEYIRNFDHAMKLINQWMEKSSKFSDIIQDIQKRPECSNLSLQHHMLGPIQRVPRYELLLKDYVRHLPDNAPDMKDAKDALDLVTKAACHSNEAMKKIETFHKLLDIYQNLRGVPVDFISPTREFVTQGPITKIAARSGERQPRQLFLFSDLVLICSQYNLLGTYSVRSLLELDSMEVKPGNNRHIPNTFLVHSKQKAVELLDENASGGVSFGWEQKIRDAIAQYKTRKQSIRHEEAKEFANVNIVPESCLGTTAPVWIPDDAASMCMLCELSFNMVRRRHHCRACGKLICKSCCKKAPLEYKQGKMERVCTSCYDVIVNKHDMASADLSFGETSPKKKGILQVKASEPGLIAGYMHCSEDGGHNWQKLWVTAHKDFVLYCFRAHEDVSALSSLPLPGHEVGQVWDIEGRSHVFCLSHKKKKSLMYQVDSEKQLKRWMAVLDRLTQAELLDENARLSSQSNSSQGSAASDTVASIHHTNCTSSQADSGYPEGSNNSLANFALDDNVDADGISQYDNVDSVAS